MNNPVLGQLRRIPVVIAIALALLVAGLLMLESSGTSGAPVKAERLHFVNTKATQAPSNGSNGGGNPAKHCTDVKGKDDPKNPHCRGASGA